MALAFLCASAAAQLASAASPGACLSNALLLGALAAALTSGGAQLSTVLLATGTADWIPGAVLLVVSGWVAAVRHAC